MATDQELMPEDIRYSLAQRHLRFSEEALDAAEQAVDDKVKSAWWRIAMREQLRSLEYYSIEHTGQIPLPGERWGQDEDEEYEEPTIECVICGGPAPAPTRGNPIEGLYCERCA